MRSLLALTVALGLASGASAGEAKAKVVFDAWDAAFMKGSRCGHVHTYVEEVDRGGEKVLRTTIELRLKLKRFSDSIELSMDNGTWETTEGKVVGTFMRQYLGKVKKVDITGSVAGDKLTLQLPDGRQLHPAPWNDEVIGLYRQQTIFRDRKVKAGDKFNYASFEPTVNLVLKNAVEVKGSEEVEVFGKKQRLLRVETKPPVLEKVQLPALITWVDADWKTVRSEVDIPLLDKVVLYRTSKEVALSSGSGVAVVDVGFSQLVKLNRRIIAPFETQSAVYRVTIRDDKDAATAFALSDRQEAKNADGNTFDLHVRSRKGPSGTGKEAKPAAEFLQSSYFITCNDAMVKRHAREAVGAERDPWKKGLRIEKWVHANMRLSSHEALAPADHVAKTLSGDCTEYAMLTAAMCRAEAVPSRTAVGLVYAEPKGQPAFAFHMWTEVWIDGEWLPLDATLGRGYIGATHLKIGDQSWHDTRNMAPLFPVVRVLGKVSIDVVSVDGR